MTFIHFDLAIGHLICRCNDSGDGVATLVASGYDPSITTIRGHILRLFGVTYELYQVDIDRWNLVQVVRTTIASSVKVTEVLI